MYLRLRRLLICFVVFMALVGVYGVCKFWSPERAPGVPFGVLAVPGYSGFGTQDFSMHMSFLQDIWHRAVPNPYRLPDQEEMNRHWFPGIPSGMPHAYSPVLLVASAPFLAVPPAWAYFGISLLNAVLLIGLTAFYLLPRIKNSVQAGAVLMSFCGYVLFDIFLMGQTAIVTTCLLAGSIVLLETRSQRSGRKRLLADLLLGLFLYLLAIKPSVALILAGLLIGERVWAALLACGAGLLLTWVLLANHYGGLISGLQDYLWILNHYCQAALTPFLQPGLDPKMGTNFTSAFTLLAPQYNASIFLTSRIVFEGLIVVLIAARWLGRISFSTQLQGLLWTFLLFCPHLLVTEDFIICLLIVEGNFFRPGSTAMGKIILVFLVANLCMGLHREWPLFFVVKVILATWWLWDLLANRPNREQAAAEDPDESAKTQLG